MIVSYFSSMRAPLTSQIEFSKYIKMVKQGIDDNHINRIKECRQLFDEGLDIKYKRLKETLPIITPHAVIRGKRQDSNVQEHSGIVSVDVDVKDNDPKILAKFNDPLALAWHRTISGKGLVVYYKVDADKRSHHDAFYTVARRLKEKYGIVADKHVKALSVPRFISYDPKAVFNNKAKAIKIDNEADDDSEEDEVPTTNIKEDQEALRLLTKQIVKEGVGVVNDRDTWVKIAAVFNRTFKGNEEGLELFDKISSISDKYKSKKDCAKVYNSFTGKKAVKEASVASLVYYMEQEGLHPDTEVLGGRIANIDEDDDEEETKKKLNWRDYLLSEEPEDEVPLVQFGDINICTQGNHSLVIGKKKSRKSLFITYLVGQFQPIKRVAKKVLIADTEQGAKHVWKMKMRLKKMLRADINILFLRGESPEMRMKIIKMAIKDMQPDMLIIDGIRDLMYDINDTKESTKIVTWIEKLTLTGLHVVNVLHLNKTDGNARGHIGSELLNKAETVIELELAQDGEITVVKCEASRDVPFEDFAFTHDMHGLPVVVDLPNKGPIRMNEDQIIERLNAVFHEKEQLTNIELRKAIQVAFEVGIVKAKKIMSELIKDDFIGTKGQAHTPNQRYYFKG